MSSIGAPHTPPEARYAARARKARGWVWRVRFTLVACVGVAIWQEPQLWPEAHAAMQDTARSVVERIEDNERVRSFIAGLTGERMGHGEKEGFADRIAGLLSR